MSSHYYPFGMTMHGRTYSNNDYRYGMNGQEKDEEIFEGAMTADYWEYDSRIGRRWEQDPITYPWQSPYACFNNNPIYFADPSGLEGEDWVKDTKTGSVFHDSKITDQSGVDKDYNKGSPDGRYQYAGKEVKGAYDTNGNMFDGDANGVKTHYTIEVKVIPDNYATKVSNVQLQGELKNDWKPREISSFEQYMRNPPATGAIYQSISPFDFFNFSGLFRTATRQAEKKLLYRVLRDDEDLANGLFAKDPEACFSVDAHVRFGSRSWFQGSQFISTTSDINVALKWAEKTGSRIAVIDATLVKSRIIDLSTRAMSQRYLKGPVINNFANKSSELLINGSVPAKAVKILD